MYCSSCGAKNNDESKYCISCGAQLNESTQGNVVISPEKTERLAGEAEEKPSAVAVKEKPKKKMKKVTVVICIAAVIIIAAAGGIYYYLNSGSRLAEKKYELGQKYLTEKKYDEAIEAFEIVLKIDAGDEDAYLGLAATYKEDGNIEQAVNVLEEAHRTLPGSGRITEELTQLHIMIGSIQLYDEIFDVAAEAFETALELSPDVEKAYVGLFEAYIGMGEAYKAKRLLDNNTEAFEDAEEAYMKTAELYLSQEDPEGASIILEQIYDNAGSSEFLSYLSDDDFDYLCTFCGIEVANGVVLKYIGENNVCEIPEYLGITEIGDEAFYENDSLTAVVIPDGVTRIGDYAFYACRNLMSISVPESLTEIGQSAFTGCINLPEIPGQEDAQTYFSDYILPDSNQKFITSDELSDFDYQRLCLARYEIFARHNCLLGIPWVQDHFDMCTWYQGYISVENFNKNILNSYELGNLKLLLEQEQILTGFILIDSDSRYLTVIDLLGLSDSKACLARNEIFAWHGRLFDVDWIQTYFDSCSWYSGYIEPDDFDQSVLNDFELENIKTIIAYEKQFD